MKKRQFHKEKHKILAKAENSVAIKKFYVVKES